MSREYSWLVLGIVFCWFLFVLMWFADGHALATVFVMAVSVLLGYFLARALPLGCRHAGCVAGGDVTPQDLKVVEGIGPKIEEVLQAHGIVNYAHLAKVAPSKIRLLLDAAGPQFQVANPETWPEQAALLRDGKLQELKEYQNFLVGGTTPGK